MKLQDLERHEIERALVRIRRMYGLWRSAPDPDEQKEGMTFGDYAAIFHGFPSDVATQWELNGDIIDHKPEQLTAAEVKAPHATNPWLSGHGFTTLHFSNGGSEQS